MGYGYPDSIYLIRRQDCGSCRVSLSADMVQELSEDFMFKMIVVGDLGQKGCAHIFP